jgi:membrane protease YdiL (CAAX protease family)
MTGSTRRFRSNTSLANGTSGINWTGYDLTVALGFTIFLWALPGVVKLPETDLAGHWFLQSALRNIIFVLLPVILVLRKRQPVIKSFLPTRRIGTDFGWGLELALFIGIFNVLAIKRNLPLIEAGQCPSHFRAAYSICNMRSLILFVFGWGILPPIGEELFFRGFLYGALRRKIRPLGAVLISAVIFSAFHLPIAGPIAALTNGYGTVVIGTLLVGLITAIVYEYSGSLLAPIMAHMGLNMSFVLFIAMKGELARLVQTPLLLAGVAVFGLHFFVSSKMLFDKKPPPPEK